ncbi:bis(5'-nucleosyl)-tetraphosphatase [Egbenema bharatensis]|uniref:bis(5'-nucleosyl)-tetraphosphatase n=1 Tax=Egbenema bharatensis TaxID=3463334 RepID=UPI003A84FE74
MKDAAFGIVPVHRHPAGDRFLLIQHHAGHWGFPKGHADPGETAQETAQREFEEETGIQDYRLLETAFVEQYQFQQQGKTIEKTVTYFPAIVQSETVTYQEAEIQAYAWLPYDAALETITFEQSKQLLVKVADYLKRQG